MSSTVAQQILQKSPIDIGGQKQKDSIQQDNIHKRNNSHIQTIFDKKASNYLDYVNQSSVKPKVGAIVVSNKSNSSTNQNHSQNCSLDSTSPLSNQYLQGKQSHIGQDNFLVDKDQNSGQKVIISSYLNEFQRNKNILEDIQSNLNAYSGNSGPTYLNIHNPHHYHQPINQQHQLNQQLQQHHLNQQAPSYQLHNPQQNQIRKENLDVKHITNNDSQKNFNYGSRDSHLQEKVYFSNKLENQMNSLKTTNITSNYNTNASDQTRENDSLNRKLSVNSNQSSSYSGKKASSANYLSNMQTYTIDQSSNSNIRNQIPLEHEQASEVPNNYSNSSNLKGFENVILKKIFQSSEIKQSYRNIHENKRYMEELAESSGGRINSDLSEKKSSSNKKPSKSPKKSYNNNNEDQYDRNTNQPMHFNQNQFFNRGYQDQNSTPSKTFGNNLANYETNQNLDAIFQNVLAGEQSSSQKLKSNDIQRIAEPVEMSFSNLQFINNVETLKNPSSDQKKRRVTADATSAQLNFPDSQNLFQNSNLNQNPSLIEARKQNTQINNDFIQMVTKKSQINNRKENNHSSFILEENPDLINRNYFKPSFNLKPSQSVKNDLNIISNLMKIQQVSQQSLSGLKKTASISSVNKNSNTYDQDNHKALDIGKTQANQTATSNIKSRKNNSGSGNALFSVGTTRALGKELLQNLNNQIAEWTKSDKKKSQSSEQVFNAADLNSNPSLNYIQNENTPFQNQIAFSGNTTGSGGNNYSNTKLTATTTHCRTPSNVVGFNSGNSQNNSQGTTFQIPLNTKDQSKSKCSEELTPNNLKLQKKLGFCTSDDGDNFISAQRNLKSDSYAQSIPQTTAFHSNNQKSSSQKTVKEDFLYNINSNNINTSSKDPTSTHTPSNFNFNQSSLSKNNSNFSLKLSSNILSRNTPSLEQFASPPTGDFQVQKLAASNVGLQANTSELTPVSSHLEIQFSIPKPQILSKDHTLFKNHTVGVIGKDGQNFQDNVMDYLEGKLASLDQEMTEMLSQFSLLDSLNCHLKIQCERANLEKECLSNEQLENQLKIQSLIEHNKQQESQLQMFMETLRKINIQNNKQMQLQQQNHQYFPDNARVQTEEESNQNNYCTDPSTIDSNFNDRSQIRTSKGIGISNFISSRGNPYNNHNNINEMNYYPSTELATQNYESQYHPSQFQSVSPDAVHFSFKQNQSQAQNIKKQKIQRYAQDRDTLK